MKFQFGPEDTCSHGNLPARVPDFLSAFSELDNPTTPSVPARAARLFLLNPGYLVEQLQELVSTDPRDIESCQANAPELWKICSENSRRLNCLERLADSAIGSVLGQLNFTRNQVAANLQDVLSGRDPVSGHDDLTAIAEVLFTPPGSEFGQHFVLRFPKGVISGLTEYAPDPALASALIDTWYKTDAGREAARYWDGVVNEEQPFNPERCPAENLTRSQIAIIMGELKDFYLSSRAFLTATEQGSSWFSHLPETLTDLHEKAARQLFAHLYKGRPSAELPDEDMMSLDYRFDYPPPLSDQQVASFLAARIRTGSRETSEEADGWKPDRVIESLWERVIAIEDDAWKLKVPPALTASIYALLDHPKGDPACGDDFRRELKSQLDGCTSEDKSSLLDKLQQRYIDPAGPGILHHQGLYGIAQAIIKERRNLK